MSSEASAPASAAAERTVSFLLQGGVNGLAEVVQQFADTRTVFLGDIAHALAEAGNFPALAEVKDAGGVEDLRSASGLNGSDTASVCRAAIRSSIKRSSRQKGHRRLLPVPFRN